MAQAERITLECRDCGCTWEAWALGTPDLDLDPQLGDPGWMQAQASATCPECGRTACRTGLAAERELYRE